MLDLYDALLSLTLLQLAPWTRRLHLPVRENLLCLVIDRALLKLRRPPFQGAPLTQRDRSPQMHLRIIAHELRQYID